MASRNKMLKINSDDELVDNIKLLQNEITNLKDIILRQKLTFQNQINDNIKQVSVSLNELKGIIISQNNVLTNVLAELNTAIKNSLNEHLRKPKYLNVFPFQNEIDIINFEAEITSDSYKDVVTTFKTLLHPGGIRKNLIRIFAVEVILDHNMDGFHGKKRLLNYTKIINSLYDAVSISTYSKDDFLTDCRQAVKAIKINTSNI